ncbi:MAG: divalent-cation tolerance protein CutA [Betaproteobacteria bacterium]
MTTTLPDRDSARNLASGLVSARMAACVNILGDCESIYRWNDAVECAAEVVLLIKTRAALYPAVERYILDNHPYQLPEVVAISSASGSPA